MKYQGAGWFKTYWLAIMIVACGFLFIHVFLFAPSFNDWSYSIHDDTASKFGSFVGGYIGTLFLLVSVVLLYVTLKNQRKSFEMQQFENRFFEMVRIARDNSSEVESKGKKGRGVFVDIWDEISDALDTISQEDAGNELSKKTKVGLAYLVTFYGVDNSSRTQLRIKAVAEPSKPELIENIIRHFEEKHRKERLENETRVRKEFISFDGHQSRLGHYFRHLFQTVNYVNNCPFLSYEAKYQYVKILRAQLSTHEQAIFFSGSLSIGTPWEIDEKDSDLRLITKYSLIKNIPLDFVPGVDLKEYYPDVTYEGEDKTKHRLHLESRYH